MMTFFKIYFGFIFFCKRKFSKMNCDISYLAFVNLVSLVCVHSVFFVKVEKVANHAQQKRSQSSLISLTRCFPLMQLFIKVYFISLKYFDF